MFRGKATRKIRRYAIIMFVLLPAFGLFAQAVVAGNSDNRYPDKIAANKVEKRVLDDTANGKTTDFVVLMAEQANVTPAYDMTDQDARGWYVYNTLKATADRSQAQLRGVLNKKGVFVQSFWLPNTLVIFAGDRALVESIASRPDVRKLESNRSTRSIMDDGRRTMDDSISYPSTTEWGVQRVNAPQVWAMGFTGQGITIGNEDTGMRWTHSALKPHYRGWDGSVADHNYNWWDGVREPLPGHTTNPCGYAITVPCDDQGHGTHTTGTTLGDDGAGNQIGVAPGAKWIGCRNMDAGDGRPSTYLSCMQFMTAPTDVNGNNPNPALRAHVINNSWGCPPSEKCAADTLQAAVEAIEAAGIFFEASVDSLGPACGTVQNPPTIYRAAFSTTAFDINNSLASFSSRGPVTVDGSNRLKPEISGPGVNIRSSVNNSDSAYSIFSGTSMAGPHVVGVVALLWSAHPELSRNITATKNLLEMTANPQVNVSASPPYCGNTPPTQIPNNYFGYGRVDALAAVIGAGGGTPTSTSTVTPTRTRTATATRTPARTPGRDAYMVLVPDTTTLALCLAPPNGGTTQVGCGFVLDLFVNTGSHDDATAQQSFMTFTYQLIQNVRVASIATSCVLTSTVTPDYTVFDLELLNEICNGPGQCHFRQETVDPGSFAFASFTFPDFKCYEDCPHVFRVAQVGLCAVAPGTARLHWQFSPPDPPTRDTEIVTWDGDTIHDPALFTDYVINIAGGTQTPTRTRTATATRTPGRDAYMVLVPNTTTLALCPAPPNGGTTQVGCGFVLDLFLNTGSYEDATAQLSYMTFTYQLIQNVRVASIATSCVLTSTVTADHTFFDTELLNEICNGPSQCHFRQETVDPGSFAFGSGMLSDPCIGCGEFFRMAQVGLCAIAPGTARLHWQFSPPDPPARDTEIVDFSGDPIHDRALFTDYVINITGATQTSTRTPARTLTPTPLRSITPCGQCSLGMLVVTSSCNVDGTTHWIAVAHNPDPCSVTAPWRAELQVRENSGNWRTVRIQYATTSFPHGDTVLDGTFCYRYPQNTQSMRVEFLFEDQDNRSEGSNGTIQEREAKPGIYGYTPDSRVPNAGRGRAGPSQCDADMVSSPMIPCVRIDSCGLASTVLSAKLER